jgi:hypothetical protein
MRRVRRHPYYFCMGQADLYIVLDEWLRPGTPDPPFSPVTWAGFCARVYSATPPRHRGRWVMDLNSYLGLQAEFMLAGQLQSYVPDGVTMLFGMPIEVRDGGGLPHLE